MSNRNDVPNKLINEKSPYLLQHAYNPVNWYPWGGEAFEKAKSEGKPIFLSIGYSTCHWCHVMADESFEDNETAGILNEDFVSIKVDREERPDIDSVYMTVCQQLTGSGGWPLTIIMTAEQKPFFAGTYLPKGSKYGMTGLNELLLAVKKLWDTDRSKLVQSGDEIVDAINRYGSAEVEDNEVDREVLDQGFEQFINSFDKQNGGFSNAPKFPTPHNLLFLLKYYNLENNPQALQMVEKTLQQMFRGGIFDHIGGGFSRYSTDEKWLVPHFEKMLYDNALLTLAYVEAYRLTGNEFYKNVVTKTLNYVLRELTDDLGGFYCGQDADSEGVEGKFYVFQLDEIKQIMQDDNLTAEFCNWFSVTEQGNFEGNNILNLLDNDQFEVSNTGLERAGELVFQYRLRRTKLHKDDKVLTSWNGLMIAAMAQAGLVLGVKEYEEAAAKAYSFIKKHLVADTVNEKDKLKVRWRDGESAHVGQLDDYAFYAFGLLNLYYCTFDDEILSDLITTAKHMTEDFFDYDKGGFYLYSAESEHLISRPKELYDGAMPSGNSVALYVLIKLAKLTGDKHWMDLCDRQIKYVYNAIYRYPLAHSFSLLALTEILYPSKELVCCATHEDIPAIKSFLTENYSNLTVVLKTNDNKLRLNKIIPYLKDYPISKDEKLFYLCQNGSCLAPKKSLDQIKS